MPSDVEFDPGVAPPEPYLGAQELRAGFPGFVVAGPIVRGGRSAACRSAATFRAGGSLELQQHELHFVGPAHRAGHWNVVPGVRPSTASDTARNGGHPL